MCNVIVLPAGVILPLPVQLRNSSWQWHAGSASCRSEHGRIWQNDLIYLHQLQAFLVLIQLNLMEADLLLLAIEIWMGTRVKLYRID